MIIRKLKLFLGISTCLVFSLWWFGINNPSMEENFYSKEEYHQDLSQIYFDIGRHAEQRGDLNTAIRAYHIALEHMPHLAEAANRLARCMHTHQLLALRSRER